MPELPPGWLPPGWLPPGWLPPAGPAGPGTGDRGASRVRSGAADGRPVSVTTAPAAATRSEGAQGALLTVDLDAVAANTRFFASRTRAEVMAVVKANGFGHGGTEASGGAGERATWLGVWSITRRPGAAGGWAGGTRAQLAKPGGCRLRAGARGGNRRGGAQPPLTQR